MIEEQDQLNPPTIADFEAIVHVFQKMPSAKEFLGFYNCGPQSGAR